MDISILRCRAALAGVSLMGFALSGCISEAPSLQLSDGTTQGPSRALLSAGGGERQSANYQVRLSVGAPLARQHLESDNFRLRVGVGTFTTR